ncbi:hypothetical protein [Rubripirellula obstinata]|uniref:hypothetical protein n=1 Tax=Rubripirellula obstinata TaxID=406547 RepID=UPI000835F99E|nr:hypothetical protein [Rubripirellula obstinata]
MRDDVGERVFDRIAAADRFFPQRFRSSAPAADRVVGVSLAAGLPVEAFGEQPFAKVVGFVRFDRVDDPIGFEEFKQWAGRGFVVLDRRGFPLRVEFAELVDPCFERSPLSRSFAQTERHHPIADAAFERCQPAGSAGVE